MKKNTLKDVFLSLDALEYEILLNPEVMSRGRGASDRMNRHGEMTS
jgi:quinolinate synthase